MHGLQEVGEGEDGWAGEGVDSPQGVWVGQVGAGADYYQEADVEAGAEADVEAGAEAGGEADVEAGAEADVETGAEAEVEDDAEADAGERRSLRESRRPGPLWWRGQTYPGQARRPQSSCNRNSIELS